jgi:hypothetical protein
VELTVNGKRSVVAGGLAIRSIDSRLFFFPPTGKGSIGIAGYSNSGSNPPERLYWTGADLQLGDEIRLRIVESDAADAGAKVDDLPEEAHTPEEPLDADVEKSCLFCQKTNREPDFFMSSNAGSICGECIRRGVEFMEAIGDSGRKPSN